MKSSFTSQKAPRLIHQSSHLLLRSKLKSTSSPCSRHYHLDGRQRLSRFWAPTGGIAPVVGIKEDSHALLIRAGFVRQAHAGLFQLLPLGLRVQDKVERLLDKHMIKLGASRLSLSSFSSEELWSKTGRLDNSRSELFRLEDRKGGKYLLSPTHEEEITALVGSIARSYKDLPLRLYQISRKYRDEPRPRQGLLRTREFLMKDLYTFDKNQQEALKTYENVRRAYGAFFQELKLPYLTAEASSGEIGGNLSHEYHFPSSKGEDRVISCESCGYTANEELARSSQNEALAQDNTVHIEEIKNRSSGLKIECSDRGHWYGVSQDRNTLVHAVFPHNINVDTKTGSSLRAARINPYALKRLFPALDIGVEDSLKAFSNQGLRDKKIIHIFDHRIPKDSRESEIPLQLDPANYVVRQEVISTVDPELNLVRIETGDVCPVCPAGQLKVQNAVEIGHTFHLGTRYSKPLAATVVTDPTLLGPEHNDEQALGQAPMQMGCHGIGVSRLIAAVADSLADIKGLNWPSVMAPFQAVIVPTKGQEEAAVEVYDLLANLGTGTIDAIIDDRAKDFGWKLKDSDLIGYPVIVVVGRDWKAERNCEIQCRRLDFKERVPAAEIQSLLLELLTKL